MKTLKKISTVILMTLSVFAFNASAQKSKDSVKYNFITIDGKGGIYSHGGTKLGYITKDNIVKDAKGRTVYFIDRDGNVIDAKGNKLGKAKKNGFYYNNDGEVVLETKNIDEERCAILDPKGHSWGYAHRNYKLHACAAHCFFLEKKKMEEAKRDSLAKKDKN
ncbi:MAG: 5-fold beta-flower protein [Mucilaginibacter sp.]